VSFRREQFHNARRWLAVTAVLGTAFAINQVRDFLTVNFSISDHAYGAIYWSATGLHGLHVVAGVGLLMLLGWRVATGSATQASMVSTAYFWHLVDVVWVALFVVIWVLQ
jgi:cytochrome c oxidase subunit 3